MRENITVKRFGRDVRRVKVRCECGRSLVCEAFTNTCACGADFNMGGYRLADRAQWGEETGESVSDILRADVDREDF